MPIRSRHRYSSLFALGALTACQHASVAPAAPSAQAAPPPAHSTVAIAPVASAPPAPAAVEPEAPDTSPFVEGVRLGYIARVAVTGKTALLSTEKVLLGTLGDRIAVEPALLEGTSPGVGPFPRIFGSMPDTWKVELSYAERTTRSSLSRWTGTGWQNADNLLNGRNVIGMSPWKGGRMLALIGDEYRNQLNFVQLSGPHTVPLPQLEHAAKDNFGCVHGIAPEAMTALATGEVFLAGTRCTVDADEGTTNHGVVVERWGAGQARGKLAALPNLGEQEASAGELTSIVATSGADVFVAGARTPLVPEAAAAKPAKPTLGVNAAVATAPSAAPDEAYLAHFDGTAWHALPAPPVERIDELQLAPEGKLWALASGDLWTTTSSVADSATWTRVPMPRLAKEAGEHAVSSFWVEDSGSVWATLGGDDFSYLVRTKRGAEALSVPPDAQIADLTKSLDPSGAYDDCEHPTLVLLTLARTAPSDADMPTVRAALRGHTELEGKVEFVEVPFLTRRLLAARGDADALSLTLEALTRARIPGVNPELRCLNAQPTRMLNLDFGGPKREQKTAPPHDPKTASVTRPRLDREHLAPIDQSPL